MERMKTRLDFEISAMDLLDKGGEIFNKFFCIERKQRGFCWKGGNGQQI